MEPYNNVDDGAAPDDQQNDYLTWDLEDAPYAEAEFPWGKHRGSRFCDVPMSYLLWALAQDFMWEDNDDAQSRRNAALRVKLLQFIWSQPVCDWLYRAMKKPLGKNNAGLSTGAIETFGAPHNYADECNPVHRTDPTAQF